MSSLIRSVLALSVIALAGFNSAPVFAHGEEVSVKSTSRHGDEAPIGKPGDAKNVSRTIPVKLLDSMRFDPGAITVKQGETVRFLISNGGGVEHEFVLGDKTDIEAHAEMMRQMPGMTHNDANMIRLAPGKSGEIIWTFNKPGKFLYACLVPGHWEAGMQGTLTVVVTDKPRHSQAF